MHIWIQDLYSYIGVWLRNMKVCIISWSQRIEVKGWGCSQIEARRLGFNRANGCENIDTMFDNGENCELFYICFFIDILRLC